jgi:hypothetical protein
MSRTWRPTKLIVAAELFGGRLAKHGVYERLARADDYSWLTKYGAGKQAARKLAAELADPKWNMRWLTDGENCVSVEVSRRGVVVDFTRYGLNDATKILHAIEREFEANRGPRQTPRGKLKLGMRVPARQ